MRIKMIKIRKIFSVVELINNGSQLNVELFEDKEEALKYLLYLAKEYCQEIIDISLPDEMTYEYDESLILQSLQFTGYDYRVEFKILTLREYQPSLSDKFINFLKLKWLK
jgi:hypothetical protein